MPITHTDLMLATPIAKPFSRAGWIFELKYDGFRVLAIKQGKRVQLLSRRGRDMAQSFPEIVGALADLPDVVIDGEIVVVDDMGAPLFERLRWRSLMRVHKEVTHAAANEPAAIFAFDLLSLNGEDMRKWPLLERKIALNDTLPKRSRIKYASHVEQSGVAFFEQVSKMELEGMVGKRADSAYLAGRSRNWLKVKTEAGRAMEDKRIRHLKE